MCTPDPACYGRYCCNLPDFLLPHKIPDRVCYEAISNLPIGCVTPSCPHYHPDEPRLTYAEYLHKRTTAICPLLSPHSFSGCFLLHSPHCFSSDLRQTKLAAELEARYPEQLVEALRKLAGLMPKRAQELAEGACVGPYPCDFQDFEAGLDQLWSSYYLVDKKYCAMQQAKVKFREVCAVLDEVYH